ncbi:MAG: bifunctional UDP-N-acetylglucosamine diphosphorylase/glucosamine-1-phosphate N-acetyltransferase GlmU [Acidobacteriota bacterium]|nr:bifunctional UDP-N-acetylglucosamine diphosphorylase/glucosamine-1-phosphate N-acetyltransferase GlmU [Acidobacteriota bacterium]
MVNEATAVILAAGQGTRMKSNMAKVLHKAGGKTLVEHVIAAAQGIVPAERVFVVVGHQAESVEAVAKAAGADAIHQTEQLGTGHAVMCGRGKLAPLGGLLLVLNGDCPMIRTETLEALIRLYRETGAGAAMITTDLDDPTGYGRIVRRPNGDVEAIVEHKAATPEQLRVREINVGFYCFDAAAFWKHVDELRTDNPAHEYYLTDMIAILLKAGHRVTALKAADSSEMLGINNRVELAAVDRIMRDRKVRQLMLDGVTVEKPETVTIDGDVAIGTDTIIGPFAQITGKTAIGANCRIGASSIIENSTLGDGVEVFPFSSISDSTLDAKAHVGPYARLRMGAHLHEGAHVGNFVELKKTDLGAGSKSMHLAYLGDSQIGAKVNIGAGTITCNYDGKKKHRTHIGDGAFVGSNSTLVAPIEVGSGSYVGAGSTITHRVPEKALAIGRSRQVNKEGWVKKES